MEQNEKDFVATCELLTKLAILKRTKIEEKEAALMAKYLLTELSYQSIVEATSFLSKRKDRFPDVADYFNLLAPMKSFDEIVAKEIGQLMGMLKDGWENSKDKFSEHQKALLEVWPWHELTRGKESDIAKTRTEMTFYLRNKLNSDGKLKLNESKKAFVGYQNEFKHLGGNNGQIENN